MKKTLVLFAFSQIAFAQKTSINTFLHFSGKIDQYPIEMTIEFQQGKDSVSGSYYYAKNGKDFSIFLNGTLKNNEVKLSETTYVPSKNGNVPKNTGSFSLSLNSSYELSGTWHNVKKDKKLDATLTCIENLTAFNPKNYRYKLNQHKGKAENTNGELSNNFLISELQIYNSKKEKVQILSGFNKVIYDKDGEVELEDLNFDGLLDIKIPIYFPDRTKYDSSFLYFIYDKKKNQFVRDTKLEALEYLFFDQKNKEFVRYEADGSGNESASYYKWSGNTFYLIRKSESFENSDKTLYTEYQIKNNKSVKVKEYQK
ncbi:XAC2610-related protein [Flavobacterium sp. FlaQc-48]|uniref:XAC2610-related protein n=1 Tax=Flavobacterium sp. FlaQc-48 TaxID=3374181 RepID=UPI003757F5EC